MICKYASVLLSVLLIQCFVSGYCDDSPLSDGTDLDSVTREALNSAFVGDHLTVGVVARRRGDVEKSIPVEEGVSEEIQTLSLVSAESLPTLKGFRKGMKEFPGDQGERNIQLLLRKNEPRQRFLEAAKDRRYEQQRRLVNSFITPFALFFQGQFSALFGIPFEGIDYYFVARKYPTPGQRKELYTSFAAAQYSGMDPVAEKARERQDKLLKNRRELETLMCDYNGDRARSRGDLHTSLFWYKKKQQRNKSLEDDQGLLDVMGDLSQKRAWTNQYNGIADGDALFYDPEEFSAFRMITDALFLGDKTMLNDSLQELNVNFPSSHSLDDAAMAQAALSFRQGEEVMGVMLMEDISDDFPDDPWNVRSEMYLQRPMFDPVKLLEEAKSVKDGRFYDFLWFGRDPNVYDESLSGEMARQRRRTGYMMASRFFFPDIIGRALFLPFMDPFPQPELADAVGYVDVEFLMSPEGEKWLGRIRRAQEIEKRWQSAIETAQLAGEEKRALSLQNKAARSLEKLGDQAPGPRQAIAVYNRLLSAYPACKKRDRVEEKLEKARLLERAVAIIDYEELKAWPELWKDNGLYLSSSMLDGRKKGGEVDAKQGVLLYPEHGYGYTDKETGRFLEVPMEEQDFLQVLHLLESRRRMMKLDQALKQPLPRKRIPLSVEAGVFPGFDVSPGLVPLDTNREEMRLYE